MENKYEDIDEYHGFKVRPCKQEGLHHYINRLVDVGFDETEILA